MNNSFKSKKQVEELKELPLLESRKTVTSNLKLHTLHIVFSVGRRQPYSAEFIYVERPTDYGNQGVKEVEEITAGTWPELIDKVVEHFEEEPA